MPDFNRFIFTLNHLRFKDVFAVSLSRIGSINHYYVLQRSLTSLPEELKVRAGITIVKASAEDIKTIEALIDFLDSDSKKELISRLIFYKAGFNNCYAAKKKNGEIVYLQWLVYPAENGLIRNHLPRRFYHLTDGQVMIENAFAFPKFRGFGLLPGVTRELLAIARESGHTSAIAYIRKDRIASLNEFIKMGFKITKLITEYRFLGMTIRRL